MGIYKLKRRNEEQNGKAEMHMCDVGWERRGGSKPTGKNIKAKSRHKTKIR